MSDPLPLFGGGRRRRGGGQGRRRARAHPQGQRGGAVDRRRGDRGFHRGGAQWGSVGAAPFGDGGQRGRGRTLIDGSGR